MTASMIARIFSKIPTIETERLTLRRLMPSDYRDMYEYASLAEVTEYLLWRPHENEDQTYRYLDGLQICYKRGEFFDWGVELKSERKLIGTCGFTELLPEHERAEIGYVLNPRYWGQGIATEAAMAVLSFGFNVLGIERAEAHYMEGNERSLAVMKKCGMSFEGMFRHYMLVKGSYRNIGISAITRDEFDLSKKYYTEAPKRRGFFIR